MPDENVEGQGTEERGAEEPSGQEEQPGSVISREALPEELRDLPEDRLRDGLRAMTQGLRSRSEEVQDLRERLARLEGASGGQTEEEVVKEMSEEEQERLKDLVLEDPVAAFDTYLERRFGMGPEELQTTIRTTQSLASEGAASGAMARAEREFEDFHEVRNDVQEILEAAGAPATFENIEGAYTMALGRRAREERKKSRKRTMRSEKPSPPEGGEKKPELTSIEKQVARSLGMSEEKYIQYRDDEIVEMEVPTG